MEKLNELGMMQDLSNWESIGWEERIMLKMHLEDLEIDVDKLDMNSKHTRDVLERFLLADFNNKPDGGVCVELQNLIDEPKVRVAVDGQTELIIGDTISEMTNGTLRQVKELLNALDIDALRNTEDKGKWKTIENLKK